MEVIAYKGMESNMTCRGFQYEIGKTYKADKTELGFYACLNPIEVFDYYSMKTKSRYFKVKLSGEITKCDSDDTNVAATEITILEEINIKEIINNTEWWKNENVLNLLYWSEGFAKVQRSDKLYNFIDKQGNYLSNEWYNDVFNFKDGFAIVQRGDGLWNFIDIKGKILSDKWFEDVFNFQEGFARVQRDNELYNFIGKDGKIISDEWFIDVHSFNDGLAIVKRTNGEWAKIDKTGKLIKNLQ